MIESDAFVRLVMDRLGIQSHSVKTVQRWLDGSSKPSCITKPD